MIHGSTLEQACIYYNYITLPYFGKGLLVNMSLSGLKLKSPLFLSAVAYREVHPPENGTEDLTSGHSSPHALYSGNCKLLTVPRNTVSFISCVSGQETLFGCMNTTFYFSSALK